jgi:hypothetical protein
MEICVVNKVLPFVVAALSQAFKAATMPPLISDTKIMGY